MSEFENIAVLREVIHSDPYHMQFSPLLDAIDTLTRERDEARTVTDAMINKGWSLLQNSCIEEYGLLNMVEREDFADALTAALAQEDA